MQDLFNRQALGEFLALSFFPLVLASLFLLRKGITKYWPLLTLAMTGIGLAHFISIEMVSIWIGLYILFYWQQFFKKGGPVGISEGCRSDAALAGLLSFTSC